MIFEILRDPIEVPHRSSNLEATANYELHNPSRPLGALLAHGRLTFSRPHRFISMYKLPINPIRSQLVPLNSYEGFVCFG